MPMPKMPKPRKGRKVSSITIGSADGNDRLRETIRANDCVLINPDPLDSTGQPYIGEVLEMIEVAGLKNEYDLVVRWFYRPEEAIGGRKAFHGEKELFKSDHEDCVSSKTVISKCRVLSLQQYQELSNIEEHDFFARFMYRPAVRIFEPPKVPVFCVCEMPYNPDKFMVQCDHCAEWYHPECLKTTRKALKKQQNWKCPECMNILEMQMPPQQQQMQQQQQDSGQTATAADATDEDQPVAKKLKVAA